jgi:hypothetical protein
MYAYYSLSGGRFLLKPLLAPGKTAAQLSVAIAPLLANLDAQAVNYTIEVSEHPTFLAGYRALFDNETAGGTFLTSSRLFQKDHVRNNNSAITAAMRSLVDGGLVCIVFLSAVNELRMSTVYYRPYGWPWSERWGSKCC